MYLIIPVSYMNTGLPHYNCSIYNEHPPLIWSNRHISEVQSYAHHHYPRIYSQLAPIIPFHTFICVSFPSLIHIFLWLSYWSTWLIWVSPLRINYLLHCKYFPFRLVEMYSYHVPIFKGRYFETFKKIFDRLTIFREVFCSWMFSYTLW